MTHTTITGIGSYLPPRVLTNADLESMVDTSDEWILSRTGISERHLVTDDQTTSDLAAEAAGRALDDAELAPSDIDLLIVATSSPDMIFPSTAAIAQRKIGLTCPAYDVMAACAGFIFGLHAGTSAIEAGRAERVLVVGADALTRFVDFTDRSTCVLFGDGAGAVVLETADEPGILHVDLGTDGAGVDILNIPVGGATTPATPETCSSGEQFLKMNGNEVFKFAVRVIPETTVRALEASGLSIDDVDWVVPHQANQRIIVTIAERLGIPQERIVSTVEKHGNTSAASIPLALDHLYTGGELSPDDVVVLVGFGAGLTWGAAIVRWTKEVR